MKMYYEIQDLITSSADIRRGVDMYESVTKQIISIAYSRGIDEEDEFNEEEEKCCL